jgi:hypothetical protein
LKDALKALSGGEGEPKLMSVAPEAKERVKKSEKDVAHGKPMTPLKPKGQTSVRALLAPYHKE